MSNRHGNSRRQAYGRRMKDLRSRSTADFEVDLDGPAEWSRGRAWEGDPTFGRRPTDADHSSSGARAS